MIHRIFPSSIYNHIIFTIILYNLVILWYWFIFQTVPPCRIAVGQILLAGWGPLFILNVAKFRRWWTLFVQKERSRWSSNSRNLILFRRKNITGNFTRFSNLTLFKFYVSLYSIKHWSLFEVKCILFFSFNFQERNVT